MPVVSSSELAWTLAEPGQGMANRSEEHTSELQSHLNLVCRLLLEKKKKLETPRTVWLMVPAEGALPPLDELDRKRTTDGTVTSCDKSDSSTPNRRANAPHARRI